MSNWLFWILKKANVLISPKPCEIEWFRRNFRPTGYLRNVLFAIFKKISPPQKWRPFWIFEFLPKMAKHKFASISLTVRDRAISSKFSTHRVSKKCTFKKFSPPQKWRPFWIFEFFPKVSKHKFASISLSEIERFRRNFRPTGYLSNVLLAIFKNFPLPTYGGHFEFSNFCPKWQNTKLILSP